MTALRSSARCYGVPTSSKAIRANMRASYGPRKGSKRLRRTRRRVTRQIELLQQFVVDARRWNVSGATPSSACATAKCTLATAAHGILPAARAKNIRAACGVNRRGVHALFGGVGGWHDKCVKLNQRNCWLHRLGRPIFLKASHRVHRSTFAKKVGAPDVLRIRKFASAQCSCYVLATRLSRSFW